jgi:uncharacterized protein YeaO (DUF488 family)
MVIRIVTLGSARGVDEGARIGTVLRPPRGVPCWPTKVPSWNKGVQESGEGFRPAWQRNVEMYIALPMHSLKLCTVLVE